MGGGNKRSFRGGGAGGSSGDANKRAKYLPKGSVSFEAAKEERKREREGRQRQRMIGGLSKKKLTLDPFKKKKKQGNSIPLGSRGFLVSCVAGKETEAGREIVDALEEEYERMAKKESSEGSKKTPEAKAAAAAAAAAPAGGAAAPAASADGEDEGEKEAAAADGEQEAEATSGAGLASALAAELSGLQEDGAAGAAVQGAARRRRRGLRFHALGLPGLVFVSGAGSAAIAAREAAAAEDERKGGAGGTAAAAAGAAAGAAAAESSSFNPSPSEVAQSLCGRVRDERAGTTRFCLRLLPADDVVFVGGGSIKADGEKEEDAAAASRAAVEAAARAITQGLRPLLAPHFAAPPPPPPPGGEKAKGLPPPARTFAVSYEKRASTATLERQIVIDAAMAALPQRKEGEEQEIKVDLDAPDATALIQVVKGAATLGVVRDYRGLLKLNLRELAAPGSTAAADNARKRVNSGSAGKKEKEEEKEEGEKKEKEEGKKEAE
jgi:hypothetical protein